ncbi:MAG: LPS export ABC transporter permease LptG [Alphaproteobacteria bacterium]|nr:LPS export ABC transporter permease LptG [Alphaproteobacteria bacterium]MBV9371358.1 LPS export ABC transporter permease LptG [Alphaproteobacteria bacterium]MBV9901822.1 LPS export ABC transporter permease LptG [Alphaproteobacteria bacterium]
MNVQFFPSRRIALYMARIFVLRCLAVLAALVVILQTLDLLGESGKILAFPGNGDSELWRYVSLRLPQLVSRFLPFAVLLGTLITLAALNQNSEIVSMKAAGISAHQIIAPLILASLFIAAASFAFNERFVTRASETLSGWEEVNYGKVPRDSGVRPNVWVRFGDDLILAREVQAAGERTELRNLTLYDRAGETLKAVISARRAVRTGDGWRLEDGSVFDVDTGRSERFATRAWGRGLDPAQFTLAKVNAEEVDFSSLRKAVAALKAAGRDTAEIESGYWHKLSGPLSVVLMPLLAAVAAFGLARSGQLFVRAVIGMALGFAYFVADNFALAMGSYGAYPPLAAAWAPFLLFLLIGETVLIRTEE